MTVAWKGRSLLTRTRRPHQLSILTHTQGMPSCLICTVGDLAPESKLSCRHVAARTILAEASLSVCHDLISCNDCWPCFQRCSLRNPDDLEEALGEQIRQHLVTMRSLLALRNLKEKSSKSSIAFSKRSFDKPGPEVLNRLIRRFLSVCQSTGPSIC